MDAGEIVCVLGQRQGNVSRDVVQQRQRQRRIVFVVLDLLIQPTQAGVRVLREQRQHRMPIGSVEVCWYLPSRPNSAHSRQVAGRTGRR